MKGLKHEIWQEPEGETMLCWSNEMGDGARALLEEGSKLIHTFYAESHFDAMTTYYEYMEWGEYETDIEIDKQPYDELYGEK